MFKYKKAQGWSLDIMIAGSIFIVGLVVFYFYSMNNPGESEETMDNLFYNGEIITESLLSEGYPKNWNINNVVTIGILDSNNKINETKLELFYNLSADDYNKTRRLFNTRYDYYFFLTETMTVNGTNIEGIGKPGFDKNNINAENLIKVTRFTIYKDKPVTAYLYIFEE